MADVGTLATLTVKFQSEGFTEVKGQVDSLKQAGAEVERTGQKASTASKGINEAAGATNALGAAAASTGDAVSASTKALMRWVERLEAANAAFGKTNVELLAMKAATASLTQEEAERAQSAARTADAISLVRKSLVDTTSAASLYGDRLEALDLLVKQGIVSATQAAATEAALTREYDGTNAAVARSAAAYRELMAAQQEQIASDRAAADAASRSRIAEIQRAEALAQSRAATISNARISQAAGVLGGSNNMSSAELARMRADATAAFGAAEAGADKSAAAVSRLNARTREGAEVMGVFKHAIGGLIAFSALGAVMEFARSIGDANVEMQKMLNTLNSASGSMSAAQSEFAFLSGLANKIGTDLQASGDAYARLAVSARAAGVTTAQLHSAFTGLSEGFAATGRSGDEMNRFLVQLEQGLSQGTIQMRDLRAMAQSFPAAFELASEAAQRMGGSLDSFLKSGGLPAQQFFLTFSQIVHEKFADAATQAADTIVGAMNRIKNALFETKAGADVVRPLTDALNDLADQLQSDQGRAGLKELISNIVSGFKLALDAVVALLKVMPELIATVKTLAAVMAYRAAVAGVLKLVDAYVALRDAIIAAQAAGAAASLASAGKSAAGALLGSTLAARAGIGVAAVAGGAEAAAGGAAAAAAVGTAAAAAAIPVALLVAGVGALAYALYQTKKAHDESEAAFAKRIQDYSDAADAANRMGKSESAIVAAIHDVNMAMGAPTAGALASALTDGLDQYAQMANQLAAAKAEADRVKASMDSLAPATVNAASGAWEVNQAYTDAKTHLAALNGTIGALTVAMGDLKGKNDEAAASFDHLLSPKVLDNLNKLLPLVGGAAKAATIANAAAKQSQIDAMSNAQLLATGNVRSDAANFNAAASKYSGVESSVQKAAESAANPTNTAKAKAAIAQLQTGYVAMGHTLEQFNAVYGKTNDLMLKNAAAADAAKHHASAAESDAQRLLDSIQKRITANNELVKTMQDTDYQQTKLTQAQQDKLAIDQLVKDGVLSVTSAMYANLTAMQKQEAASDAAVASAKAHAQALKDQAEAAKKVAAANAAVANIGAGEDDRLAAAVDSVGTGKSGGVSKEAMRSVAQAVKEYNAQLKIATDNGGTLAVSLDAVKQHAMDTAVAIAGIDLAGQLEQQAMTPLQRIQQQMDLLAQSAEILGEKLKNATDPKDIARFTAALALVNKQQQGMKFQGLAAVAGLAGQALQGMQSLTKEGSKSYAELEVAIRAAAVAQAILAVLSQAAAGPGVGFAMMAAMAAAVAPLLAQLGASIATVAGAGFTDTAKQRQETQGTGSVLGDTTAQSQSITNAVQITADATSKLVGINTSMLHAMQALQAGLGSAATMLARGAGDVSFDQKSLSVGGIYQGIMGSDPLGSISKIAVDPLNIIGGILGGKSKVTDQGIKIIGGTLSQLINDTMVGAYEEVQSKSWAFGSTHTKEGFKQLGNDVSSQFSLIFKSISDAVASAAVTIGLPLADVQKKIAQFQVATQNISLKGLSAEDQQKALEAVFSKIFDDLAASVVPFAKQFQKVGEGMAETLVRVATEVQVMQRAVDTLGVAVRTSDPEKFAQISDALATLMGGVDNFIDGMNDFIGKFAPDTVKLQQAHDQLAAALAQVGLALPATRDGMWALMQTLDATTTAGQAQIATLLQLAGVADSYYSMMEKGVDTLKDKAQALADTLYGSLGTSLDAINKKLDELRGKTQSALGAALGANSPLSAQDQLNLALKGLASGLTTVDQVLSIGKKLYRGADYRELYNQVMASQGIGGSVSDVGAAVDQYNKLFQQQQALQKQKDAMDRFNNAKQLADYVVQMSTNQHESFQDVATGLGFNLNDLGKDLGVSSIIGYLDKLQLEGAGTGKEQVAALNTLNSTANSQLTTLKSIDKRLSNLEKSSASTASNTGATAQQGRGSSLAATARGSRVAA